MKASRATLQALWLEVLTALHGRLQASKKVPVELLTVARQFLRDNRQAALTARDRKALEQLHRLYSLRLAEAMQADHIPAAALAECRKWLEYHGVKADLPAAVAKQVAQKLADGSLPFSHDNKQTQH